VLALWGIVISAVYMLRAFRATFMGTMPEQWTVLPDLRRRLRLPVALLIAGLLWLGFFPQTFVRVLTPVFRGATPVTTSHSAASGDAASTP
jgi:NADH-quinone oxidoreductase subunit M